MAYQSMVVRYFGMTTIMNGSPSGISSKTVASCATFAIFSVFLRKHNYLKILASCTTLATEGKKEEL